MNKAFRVVAVLVALVFASGMSACATTAPGSASTGASGKILVVAAENFWGDLAAQLGGDKADVHAIISNPAADPHDYEPTAADAQAIHSARLAIVNGIGYDTWASKLAAANPSDGRILITVGDLVREQTGGNPHRWYDPDDVRAVLNQITASYQKIDPADSAYFAGLHDTVLGTSLKRYFDLIAEIRSKYAGTPVGASESIFTPLAEATGLKLLTPESFLDAISEGGEPTAADKITIDRQINDGQIKVYVYNRQNATPDVTAQVAAAKKAGIPVTTITETLVPAGASFQDWQVAQLESLLSALHDGTLR